MLKRRDFLVGCGVVAVGTGLGSAVLGDLAPLDRRTMPLVKDRFLPLVNSWFDVQRGSARARMKLLAVVDRSSSPAVDQFSLRFVAPRAAGLEGLCELRHPSTGTLQLYLGATREDASRAYYAADFSLLRDPALGSGRV